MPCEDGQIQKCVRILQMSRGKREFLQRNLSDLDLSFSVGIISSHINEVIPMTLYSSERHGALFGIFFSCATKQMKYYTPLLKGTLYRIGNNTDQTCVL